MDEIDQYGFIKGNKEFNRKRMEDIGKNFVKINELQNDPDIQAIIGKKNLQALFPNIGASSTNVTTDFSTMGALGKYMQPAMAIMDNVYKIDEPTEREKDINLGRMALKFFTDMSKAASQPGATVLSSGVIAGQSLAEDYLNKALVREQTKKKTEQSKKAGAVSLAMQLKSAQDALDLQKAKIKPKYVSLFKGKDEQVVIEGSDDYVNKIKNEDYKLTKPSKTPSFTYKSVQAGIPATYVTEEDAIKLLEPYVQNGLDPNSNAYKNIIKKITVPEDKPNLLGKEVIVNNMFGIIKPVQIGEKIGDVVLQGNKDAPAPSFVDFKKEYSKKYGKEFQGTVGTYAEVIPRIQQAMDLLISKNGPDTGRLEEFTLPFRDFVRGVLGNTDPEINQQQTLQAISFYLATKMRPKGSGSTSDMEFRAYQKAALSLGNTPITNYISLYAMKKMKENAELLNEKAFELIDSGEVRSVSELNAELKKIDRGIFEKFEYDGEMFDENNQLTPEFIAARDAWEESLPSGAVIVNSGIYPEMQDAYLIKDWRVR